MELRGLQPVDEERDRQREREREREIKKGVSLRDGRTASDKKFKFV